MNNIAKGCLVVLLLPVLLVAFIGSSYISYSNQEVALRAQFEAQQKTMLVAYDDTWKTIKQQAKVTDKYQSTFAKVYPELMQGRYGDSRNGTMMKFVQEANPNLEPRLFERLMDTIESNRKTFTREQKKLLDIKREHDQLLNSQPASWYLSGRTHLVAKLITSSRSEKALKTGRDDDISVF